MFNPKDVNLSLLTQRAFNLRWATVPQDVIPLTAADPDFPIAPPIKEALLDYVKGGYLSYGPAEGLLSFRQAVSADYKRKNQVDYKPEHILPVDSAAFGIYLICSALLKPGDEVIVFDPVDFLFKYSVEQVGAKAVAFKTPQTDNILDFSQLNVLITAKTKLICLCNPLNPTGKVFTKAELEALAEIVANHDELMVLSDEIWSDIVFAPNKFNAFSALNDVFDRTITVTGYSKSYGLAGLRIGSLLMPNQKIYDKIFAQSLHQSTVHGANVLGQIAAQTALNDAQDWLKEFVSHLHKMRDLAVDRLNAMPGVSCKAPQGCYVLFPDISKTGFTASELQKELIEKAKVAVVPGLPKWFGEGAQGYIRLSFATSESLLNESLNRIENFLSR
jgi:aminotransferase